MRLTNRTAVILFLGGTLMMGIALKSGFCEDMTFVKKWKPTKDFASVAGARIVAPSQELENEKGILSDILKEYGSGRGGEGIVIKMEIAPVSVSIEESRYGDQIRKQSYLLKIDSKAISLKSPSPMGVFYGVQTLARMIDSQGRVPCGEVLDWPDIPIRMIMLDPARQNENMDYYKKVIRFCSGYRINSILMHLTDDQTSCLFHEDYPWLMHPQAWKPEQIRELVKYAAQFHIELVPEIESFGHARMFVRHPEFREILHQTKSKIDKESWVGTEIEGYTNVLCPASEKAYAYLDKMYERAAQTFPSSYIHIGCDEVDMTECARCKEKFPDATPSEWFRAHLTRCRELAEKHGRKIALWGDMILKNPDIFDGFPREGVIIYDWHYREDTKEETVQFFKERGFEVIGSPALVCSPHMVIPVKRNYENIRIFAEIARNNDIQGLNTTIWVPTRYMSDVLWNGIAFAGERSWGGSHFNEEAFCSDFMRDFFGSDEGATYYKTWKDILSILWYRNEFNAGCWIDEKSLGDAQTIASSKKERVKNLQQITDKIQKELKGLRAGIRKNREAWDVLERSVAILEFSLRRLMASEEIRKDGKWNMVLIREMDRDCAQIIKWIEEDWDRNRYPDDPNKNGLYLPEQHILYRFKQMREFHDSLLKQ